MASKKYHDKDWLREKYHGELMTLKEIGDLCGVSRTTISDWLGRHGIDKRSQKETQRLQQDGKHTDREWLADQYHGKGRTLKEMAAACDVDAVTIMNWMDRYDIPRRDATNHKRQSPAQFFTDHEGYELVRSKTRGENKQARVHQLVAIANGADPHNLFGDDYHVHHMNEVPWDNRPENLSVLENAEHKQLHSQDQQRADTGEFL